MKTFDGLKMKQKQSVLEIELRLFTIILLREEMRQIDSII